MDLSKFDLTEEVTAAIQAEFTKETEGLRNKNEQLLGEKKSIQGSVAEQAQIAEDARQAAVKAEEARLKASNDMDGLKSHYETQLAEQTATANEAAKAAQQALLSRDKGTALNQVKNLIHDDFKDIASAQLSNMLKVGYNDQQQPVTTFEHDGKVVANNIDEFKSWAGEQPQFAKILKGVDSSGAGTTRSQSNGVASGKLTLTEQAIQANKLKATS
tara:strand:- start:312 stop:959 length:648 start_codon:yes stop_codon:yes gene_type:complete